MDGEGESAVSKHIQLEETKNQKNKTPVMIWIGIVRVKSGWDPDMI